MRSSGLAIPTLVVALLACAGSPRVEFDAHEDFSRYRTWAWLPRASAAGETRDPAEEALGARVREGIGLELGARGYRPAEQDPPDFYVTYHLRVVREVKISTETPAAQMLSSHHQSPSYVVTASQKVVRVYERGTLAIDVAEGRDRQLVWRGVGTRRARHRFEQEVPEAVAEILERFPPRGEDRGADAPAPVSP